MVTSLDPANRIDAEAAAWVARLQGDGDPEAFKRWLERDPAHGDAFERATDAWMLVPGAALLVPDTKRTITRSRDLLRPLAMAASLLLVVGIAGWVLPFDRGVHYSTVRGEQRVSTLSDGSRIALNTESEIDIHYAPDVRRVRLERGEAMFEVAHDIARPFIVEAGTKRIQALGTAFVVRRRGADVTVTLVEGRVRVTDAAAPREGETMLTPGERLLSTDEGTTIVDRQAVESATAWRRGQIIFDDTPLADAISEMRRYGGPSITLEDPRDGALPISGVFAANAAGDFARAAAALHGLDVEIQNDRLRIARKNYSR